MRVVSGSGAGPVARPGARGSSPASGFQVGAASAPTQAPAASEARPAAAAGALLSLQAVGDPTSGRRRAVRRGRQLLDQLDGLRVALLTGRLPAMALERLRGLIASSEAGGDPEMAAVIAEIELRVEVELAKLERLSPAAA